MTGIISLQLRRLWKKTIVVGYTIKFRKADPITIYNGKDGKDGEDGKDGGMPNVTISYTDTSIVFTFSDKTVIEIPFSSSDFIKSIISVTFVPEFYDGLPTMYYGKANCYMAPAGKSYSFYAMTKGNSSESVGTPTEAELLWETQCGADALEKNYVVKDVVFDSGYVYFTAVADGNAVIAVKDAGGNILWSWHIWVTDYNPNNEYDTYINSRNMVSYDGNEGS